MPIVCQLLGLNCATPTDAVFSFKGFRRRGGATDAHADGWGVAFFEGRGVRLFIDPDAAARSPMADFLEHYPIRSRNVIAHVRKATFGRVALENTHPFMRELWGRYWVFAHNGDLHGYQPKLHRHFHPVGDTDSERAFCWLLQELDKSHASLPPVDELTATLRELVPHISRYGTFNFLLSCGDAMWAHCSTQLHYRVRDYPFSRATLADEDWTIDFSTVTQPGDRVAVIVTTPLTRDEVWIPFAPGELRVFVDGAPMTDTGT